MEFRADELAGIPMCARQGIGRSVARFGCEFLLPGDDKIEQGEIRALLASLQDAIGGLGST